MLKKEKKVYNVVWAAIRWKNISIKYITCWKDRIENCLNTIATGKRLWLYIIYVIWNFKYQHQIYAAPRLAYFKLAWNPSLTANKIDIDSLKYVSWRLSI